MQNASFDKYAAHYDEHFTFSPIGLLQRQLVYKNLLPLLNKNKDLLELNCGTGHDALELIKYVRSVLATDASPEMIRECLSKTGEGVPGLNFKVAGIQDIKSEVKKENFIFSNFAGLNCLNPSELKNFAKTCDDFTGKELDLFFVILGRKCIWERIYFLLKLNPAKAFRRRRQAGVPTVIGTTGFDTWYYSPKEIKQFFDPAFQLRSSGPIGLFVPPSYLGPFFDNKKKLLKLFGALDKLFCNFKMAANYGDHFYIHLRKIN